MGINTVTLYICHHQIVETDSDTFFSIFLDLGMKYYFLLSFFCWIGLDLILVSIPFCFPSLSLSLFSNICVHSFFFPGVLIWKTPFDPFHRVKTPFDSLQLKENKLLKSVNCNQKERGKKTEFVHTVTR